MTYALTAEIVLGLAIPKLTDVIKTGNRLSNYTLLARVAEAEISITRKEIETATRYLLANAHKLSRDEQLKLFNAIVLLSDHQRNNSRTLKQQIQKI